jgi:hypothetical protein
MKLQSNENVDRHIHHTHTSDAADSSDHDPSFRCQVPNNHTCLALGIWLEGSSNGTKRPSKKVIVSSIMIGTGHHSGSSTCK